MNHISESNKDQENSILKGIEILQTENVKVIWNNKKKRILDDKIDVTSFVLDLIEGLGKINDIRNHRFS